jgi:hypothetical protein
MVANPVGRSALAGGEWSQVRVRPKSPVILRFALRVYDSPNGGATDPSLYAKEALGDQR